MLFGTSRRLKSSNQLRLKFGDNVINNTKSYKYLGTTLDTHLNLGDQFDKVYKKASTQTKLLSKIRKFLTPDAVKAIVNSYIKQL